MTTIHDLILGNMKLVYHVAKPYKERQDYEDIVQVGMEGLCQAAYRYDHNKGVKFSTYAVSYISGKIKTYYRTFAICSMRLPKSEVTKIMRGECEYPAIDSLNGKINDENETELIDFLPSQDDYELEEACLARVSMTQILNWVKGTVSKRVYEIYCVYLTGCYRQREIAKMFGVSQPSIYRAIKRVEQKLQAQYGYKSEVA